MALSCLDIVHENNFVERHCSHHVLFWPQVNEGDEIDITKSKENSVVELSRFKVLTIDKNHTKKNKRRLSGVRFARIFMPREEFDKKYKSSDWKVLHGLQHRLTLRQRGKCGKVERNHSSWKWSGIQKEDWRKLKTPHLWPRCSAMSNIKYCAVVAAAIILQNVV